MKNEGMERISFRNFRIFKDTCEFELVPLTILTGANSSGKSTVIKGLKLFRAFEENKEGDWTLHFEEGTHQLGDFDFILNDLSKEKEITIRYTAQKDFLSILFGVLSVENVFELDEGNEMKNGRLKRSSVYSESGGEAVLLYRAERRASSYSYYLNKTYIRQTYAPKFKKLYDEWFEYRAKMKPYVVKASEGEAAREGEVKTIRGYRGAIATNWPRPSAAADWYFPQITREFCDYLHLDYAKAVALDRISGLFCDSFDDSAEGDRAGKEMLRSAHALDVDEYFPKPELLRLVGRIPLDAYDCFEQRLWALLLRDYPELEERFTFDAFLGLFAGLDRQIRAARACRLGDDYVSLESVKKFITESGAKDFHSFCRQLLQEAVEETSVYETTPGERDAWYKRAASTAASFDALREKSIRDYPKESDLKALVLYLYFFEYNLFIPPKGECVLKTGEPEERETLRSFMEKTERRLKDLSYGKIQTYFSNVFFVESIRANTQRLYTYFSQGTSFNEFLLKFMRNQYQENEKRFLSKWIKEFEIGDDLDFRIVRGVGSQLFILRGKKRINVVDLGYGVTQFLPVLLHIIYNYHEHETANGISLAVQEPETNLHPKLQSKLADLFVDAHRTFGVRFIIETHSEYLIRKLQYLTARGLVGPGDTLIHYLSHNAPQLRKIRILPDGRLSEPFGQGFFDEADNLALELLPYSLK
jgi:AAA15 family ATPase/GTPase